MARVNLSVPDELKARMDGFPSVNWSAVAQEAFRAAITIAELRNKGMNNEADTMAGLERLRAERRANTAWHHAFGEEQGRDWALKSATFPTLERVARLEGLELPGDEREAAALLYGHAHEDEDGRSFDGSVQMDDEAMWDWVHHNGIVDTTVDDPIIHPARIAGFIAGAAAVYRQV